MISLLIYLLVLCLVLWLFYYVINTLAPEPFRRVLNVVLMVVGVIILIYFLLNVVGPGLSAGPSLRHLR